MPERQRRWDIHEAVILLEGLLEVLEGKVSRSEAIKRVSSDLREMARQQGEDIDDVFRNENGIFFQMQSIESAIKECTVSNKPATKLFEQAAEIYRTDMQEYERLLKEARSMINHAKSCESDFMTWLSAKVSPAQLSELYWCYSEIESSCMKAKILRSPLFETTDEETIRSVQRFLEQNKMFHARHLRQFSRLVSAGRYYLAYITENVPKEGKIEEKPKIQAVSHELEKPLPTKSVSSSVDESPVHSTAPKVMSLELDEEKPIPEIYVIDFENPEDYTYTKPYSFLYFEESREPCFSWKELYVTFFATLEEDYPHLFHSGMSFSSSGGRIELTTGAEATQMFAPKQVPGTDYIIETNISAADIVRKMKYILNLCAVDYENVVIQYVRKAAAKEPAETPPPESHPHQVAVVDRSSFYNYLLNVQKLAPATCKNYTAAIINCEAMAQERHFASHRLFTSDYGEAQATVDALFRDKEFTEYNKQWHNQPTAAIAKLLIFVRNGGAAKVATAVRYSPPAAAPDAAVHPEYHNELYEQVLREKFRRGFRMDSAIEIRRFRKSYADVHGMEPKESDTEISRIIGKLCIAYNDRAYLPEVMLSKALQEKLLAYIEECFQSGKTTIYYQALCTKFAEDFLDYPLYNDPEALRVYLAYVNGGKFYMNRSSLSKTANAVADPLQELRICMKEFGRPVKYEEIFAALPHLPQSRIKQLLATNSEFISNGQGTYFHQSAVQISEEELEDISKIIEQAIAEKEFISGNELYAAIRAKYPYIIEGNTAFSVYGFRDALGYKFRDRFSFRGNIISAPGKEISMTDVFADFAKSHDSFTMSELEVLAKDLNSTIYFDAVYANSLRISQEQFVSQEQAQFHITDTDAALDRVCTGDYIAIGQVDNLGIFPYAGFPWNSFLLEHYVYAYSKDYRLLNAGFHKTECTSAIVKRSIGIDNLDDFIVLLLTDADVKLEKTSVLQFLVDNGYLARRRYTNIEKLIVRARAQRSRKETD